MKPVPLILILFFLSGPFFAPVIQAQPDSFSCKRSLQGLEKKKGDVALMGGIWSLYEAVPELKDHSTLAVQLDSKINELMATLHYLCETVNGVPLNDLAIFVTKNMNQRGPGKFREHLLGLGHPKEEIDTWFEFTRGAVQNQKRILAPETVRKTIRGAEKLLDRYAALGEELKSHATANPVVSETRALMKDLEGFLSSDPNTSLAIKETSRIPHWDVDEDVGGS